MTKEELKKEAEEYALNQWEGNLPWSVIQKSYYDGAEPREKRIAELEHQLTHRNCVDCSNHSSKLKMRVLELEAQIEKMKEVISELIAITDKDICKECDGGIHCSECYVNHAQTYASHFINEKEIKEK